MTNNELCPQLPIVCESWGVEFINGARVSNSCPLAKTGDVGR